MTGNRLTAAASANAFSSIEEMREWCWDRNVMARDAGWQHWLYVSQDKETQVHSIRSRNGADAADADPPPTAPLTSSLAYTPPSPA